MSKLADVAQRTLSAQTVKIDEIIAQYGGVVTINSLTYAEYKGDRVPVFGFVEGEGAAFWGGCKKLRELATNLEEDYGDLREVNAALRVEGIRIKLNPTIRTKGGNMFRPVNLLGTVEFSDCDEDTGEIFEEGEFA